MTSTGALRSCSDYHVAWICPLADVELLPSRLMLDEEHSPPPYDTWYDENTYRFGTINGHAVVLATCPQGETGNVNAGRLTGSMFKTFPNIRIAVLVGIGGAIPRAQVLPDPVNNIQLGDVVVGWPGDGKPACVYHDRGKSKVDGEFELVGTLQNPEWRLTQALSNLVSDHEMGMTTFADQVKRLEGFKKFAHPGYEHDKLFKATTHHNDNNSTDCADCDHSQLIVRPPRELHQSGQFVFHQGRIATGNSVIRDGKLRDEIGARCNGAICVEMEAAGVDINKRCLVIRGISDYADSHKNDKWKDFAAGNAAAFTRELLCRIQPDMVKQLQKVPEGLWFVPLSRTPFFSGREVQLEKSQEHVLAEGCRPLAIHALGGCGKTALALELAYQIREKDPTRSIFWVPAMNWESFEQAYKEIGVLLDIPGINDKDIDVKRLVQTALSDGSFGSWLMVVDNAEDVSLLFGPRPSDDRGSLIDFLPHNRKGSIVFTTRSLKTAIKLSGGNVISLSKLEESEATEMLQRSLLNQEMLMNEEVVLQFLEMLAFLPLAIVQAVAFINANTITLSAYKNLYERSQENAIGLLSEEFEDQTRYTDAEHWNNPVATTWFISLKMVEEQDEKAIYYLSLMSVTAHNDIPMLLLESKEPDINMIKAIGILKSYAFVTERTTRYDQDDQDLRKTTSFDVHPLVHLATRNWLKKLGRWDIWLDSIIRRLSFIVTCGELVGEDFTARCLHHAKYAVDLTKVEGDHVRCPLLTSIGYCERALGNFKEAERAFREARDHEKDTQGVADISTLLSENTLGWTLMEQKKHTEAITQNQAALAQIEEARGENDFLTLMCKANLAKALSGSGQHRKAVKMFQDLVTRVEILSGEESEEALVYRTYLAQALHFKGDNRRSEKIHRETIALRQRLLGAEHPDTARSLNHLAVVLCRRGKYSEAEKMHRQAFTLMAKHLGKGDSDTLESKRGLAVALSKQGKAFEAEQAHRELLTQSKQSLGNRHPKTLIHMQSLGLILSAHGKRLEAITLMKQCYELGEELYGPDHPDTKAILDDLKEMQFYWTRKVVRLVTILLFQVIVGYWSAGDAVSAALLEEHIVRSRKRIFWSLLIHFVITFLIFEGYECWMRLKRHYYSFWRKSDRRAQAC